MPVSRTLIAIAVSALALLALLAGCTSSPERRVESTPCPPLEVPKGDNAAWETSTGPCGNHFAIRFESNHRPSHGVNYVEIDEQGMLHDRAAAEATFEWVAQPPSTRFRRRPTW